MNGRASATVAAVCAAIVVFSGCAHRGQVASVPALKVGQEVTVGQPTAIAELAADPARFLGRLVRLEGVVAGVCQGSGCWVEVEGADGGRFMAKSLDESILLPTDCSGQKIVVQGMVVALTPEPEHAQAAEAEGHVCPQPRYVVSTQGAELYAALPARPRASSPPCSRGGAPRRAGGDHAGPDDHRTPAQAGVAQLLDGREEGVDIQMQNRRLRAPGFVHARFLLLSSG
jgi:hypothetical protein